MAHAAKANLNAQDDLGQNTSYVEQKFSKWSYCFSQG